MSNRGEPNPKSVIRFVALPGAKLDTFEKVPLLHWGALVFWAFAAFLCVMMIVNRAFDEAADRARAWPMVNGTVVETGSHSNRVCGSGKASGKCRDDYFADIVYEYEVSGKRYRAKGVEYDQTGRTKGEVDDQLARYRLGTQVPVHYDPDDPSSAYLEIIGVEAVDTAFRILTAAAACMVLAGLAFNWVWRRHARQVIEVATGLRGTARLEHALSEDGITAPQSSPGTDYREQHGRDPEEVEHAFERAIARLVPGAKVGALGFISALALTSGWCFYAIVAHPARGVAVWGSVAAATVLMITFFAGALLVFRPLHRRLRGRGRPTFEATWGRVLLSLIPLMGLGWSVATILQLRNGRLRVGGDNPALERCGPERVPLMLLYSGLALIWPLSAAFASLYYLLFNR